MPLLGRVKWFSVDDGIGFIRNLDDPTDEIFVHHSQLKTTSDCFHCLYEGEYVEYEEGAANKENYKKQAIAVTGIRGGPLLCEVKHSFRAATNRRRPKKGSAAAAAAPTTEA